MELQKQTLRNYKTDTEIETVYLAMISITNRMGTFASRVTWFSLFRVELA